MSRWLLVICTLLAVAVIGCNGGGDEKSSESSGNSGTQTATNAGGPDFWNDFFVGRAQGTQVVITAVATPRATATPVRTPTRTPTRTGTATTGTATRTPTAGTATRVATASGTVIASPVETGTAVASGAPAVEQLEQALLTEDDFDDIFWFEADSGTLRRQYPAVFADFESFVEELYVTVELYDARNGVPDTIALSFLTDLDLETLTQVTHAGYGTNGVRYRYDYLDDGDRWYGEVAAWQHGGVIAAILVEGLEDSVCVCDYAKTLDVKLRTVFR